MRDWRRVPHYTALDDVLTGTARFSWPRAGVDGEAREADAGWREGLLGTAPEA